MSHVIKTVTVLIGNSDNKLTQQEWSHFHDTVYNCVCEHSRMEIQFCGTSEGRMPWQNACWVVQCGEDLLDVLERDLTGIRERFRQDSIAIVIGDTRFI